MCYVVEMFAILISRAWPQYYASSPFKNFLDIDHRSHPDFEIISTTSEMFDDPMFVERLRKFSAIVVDEVMVNYLPTDLNRPCLLIDGDPHRHRPDQVPDLVKRYEAVDYVLGYPIGPEDPRYSYPPIELRKKKCLYYPHAAPGTTPPKLSWAARRDYATLSGSMDPSVYPFRALLWDTYHPNIERWTFQATVHEAYFRKLSQSKAAITCNAVVKYTVAKYFEIPWCGCLLLAKRLDPEESELLGFIPEVNCFFTDHPTNLLQYISSLPSYATVATAGHSLVMQRHTILSRLEYLSRLIKRILQGKNFKAGDELDLFKTAHVV